MASKRRGEKERGLRDRLGGSLEMGLCDLRALVRVVSIYRLAARPARRSRPLRPRLPASVCLWASWKRSHMLVIIIIIIIIIVR